MCDSFEARFKVNKSVFQQQYANHCQQLKEILTSNSRPQSPLTGATFDIKIECDAKGELDAISVSVNIPACTVGNNVILDNAVWSAAKITYCLLQYTLLKNDWPHEIANVFDIENAEITKATLTYLFLCDNHEAAVQANRDLFHRGEVLKKPKDGSKYTPVRMVGGSEQFTSYFDGKGFSISSYVKSGPTPRSYSIFDTDKTETRMYEIGRRLLRVEINLQHLWLEANNLNKPASFKNGCGVRPYLMCFKVIRDYFRMDENFRTRRPKPVDLQKLISVDREIIEMHLAGKDWRTHSVFDGKSSSVQSKKRRQFFEELRLDMNIEWQKQSELLPAYLPELMQYNNRYKPSAFEREHSFCHPRIKTLLIELRKLVKGQSDSDEDGYQLDLS